MTIVILRDLSDYDPDPVSLTGLVGVTHKATEGTLAHSKAMGTKLAARLNAAKALPVLGSYHVVRTPGNGGAGTLAQQLAYWVARVDDQVPWWRSWPHWVMQVDAEKWPYDPVSPNVVLQFAALLTGSGLPGWKVTYASRGQYGDTLRGIATPLWNADYRGGPSYPGDSWTSAKGSPAGWAPYSGQTPEILQFAGGPDMNAFRGSLDDLLNLISPGGDMAQLTDQQVAALLHAADIIGAAALGWDHTWDKQPVAFMATLNAVKDAVTQPASAPDVATVKAALLDPDVLAALAKAVVDAAAERLQT